MKAALIIDMQENCEVCPLERALNCRATASVAELERMKEQKPLRCPLKAIPEMSMTESEAIEEIVNSGIKLGAGDYVDVEALKVAVKALEEVQQYRTIIGLTPEELKLLEKDEIQTIGEVLKTFSEWYKYRAIGTVSEFRELKEKATAKKVDVKEWIYTKCDCGYEFSKHHGDGYYSIPYERQTNYCPNCGQRLLWD